MTPPEIRTSRKALAQAVRAASRDCYGRSLHREVCGASIQLLQEEAFNIIAFSRTPRPLEPSVLCVKTLSKKKMEMNGQPRSKCSCLNWKVCPLATYQWSAWKVPLTPGSRFNSQQLVKDTSMFRFYPEEPMGG